MNNLLPDTSTIHTILSSIKEMKIIEIGVYHAENAKACLKKYDIDTYILIDPYIVLDYNPKLYGTKELIDKNKNIAHRNLSKYQKKKNIKIIWIEETAEKAAGQLENNYYDVVYIDGNHEFEYVLKDIKNYVPKLKKGGIIIGDDYYDPKWEKYIQINNFQAGKGLLGVTKAVKKYCSENNIAYNVDYPAKKERGGSLKFWWKVS